MANLELGLAIQWDWAVRVKLMIYCVGLCNSRPILLMEGEVTEISLTTLVKNRHVMHRKQYDINSQFEEPMRQKSKRGSEATRITTAIFPRCYC